MALCTGTGPGLTPAIRAGKGCWGRRESDSQVTCHPIRCMPVVRYRQRYVINTPSEPPPPPPPGVGLVSDLLFASVLPCLVRLKRVTVMLLAQVPPDVMGPSRFRS